MTSQCCQFSSVSTVQLLYSVAIDRAVAKPFLSGGSFYDLACKNIYVGSHLAVVAGLLIEQFVARGADGAADRSFTRAIGTAIASRC